MTPATQDGSPSFLPSVTRMPQIRPSQAVGGWDARQKPTLGKASRAQGQFVVPAVVSWRTLMGAVRHRLVVLTSPITPLGWLISVSVIPFLCFGYRWSWTTLVVLGFVGIAIVMIGVSYLITLTPVGMSLGVVDSRVVAGDPATGILTVTNSPRHRSGARIVEVPIDSGVVELPVPTLARARTHVGEFPISTQRRGRITVGPARTVRSDPLGIVRKVRSGGAYVELVVHPKTTAISTVSSGLLRDLEGTPTRDVSDSDVSFHALREYQEGDDRRHIHWKSTAKTGTYMVRQFEETRRSHIMIALSVSTADYATEAEFELAVSVTGSLGIQAMRDVREVSVVVGERAPELARGKTLAVRSLSAISRDRLLDDLATVELADAALSILDVARVAGHTASGVSMTFLICGSNASKATLRSASLKFPAGIDVVAVVCNAEATPGLRQVAGLWLLTIGFLDDLRPALSRVIAR